MNNKVLLIQAEKIDHDYIGFITAYKIIDCLYIFSLYMFIPTYSYLYRFFDYGLYRS